MPKTTDKLARVHVHLSDDQRAALKRESERTSAPIAAIIRRAITAYIKANPHRRTT